MSFTPDIPTFTYSESNDGKKHLYLLASNETDIEIMLHIAGLKTNGINRQNNSSLNGYYRIIKDSEIPKIKTVFP